MLQDSTGRCIFVGGLRKKFLSAGCAKKISHGGTGARRRKNDLGVPATQCEKYFPHEERAMWRAC